MEHDQSFHWWDFFPKKEINQIYLSVALRAFSISLISIFVPMYLYFELAYGLEKTLGFFIFYSLIFALTTPLAAKYASKYGLKHSILLSVPFYLGYFFLLHQLSNYNIPLPIVASFLGTSMAFFWMGMHLEFRKVSTKNHRGEEVGKRQAIALASTLFGPLLGGFLISNIGFKLVFLLSALLLAFSAVFLFASKEKHVPYHFSIRSIWSKKYWRNAAFYTYRGTWAMANGVLWPLFMFIILKDYFSLGILGSFAGATMALLMFSVGKLSDKIGKRKIFLWTVPLESLSWIIRGFVGSFFGFLGISLFQSLSYGVISAPMGALQYDRVKGNEIEYFISREIFICLGRILVLSLVLLTGSFISSFWLVALASFLIFIF